MENLRYKSVFDIIGPVMIGPSSSHTAGAARIGKILHAILGGSPDHLEVHLFESFAKTYKGHGTDVAIVAGVLGMDSCDSNLKNAFSLAKEKGMDFKFIPHLHERCDHPNTVKLVARKGDYHLSVTGCSIGGGMIQVTEFDGFDISLTAGNPTLIIVHRDTLGIIAKVTTILSSYNINVAKMHVTREAKGKRAIMVLEVDCDKAQTTFSELEKLPELYSINFFE